MAVDRAGVRDHDVEPAVLLHRIVHQRCYLARIADVAGHEMGFAAGELEPVGGLLALAGFDVGEHHLGALLDEALGDGEADPLRGSGDDGDLVLELHVASSLLHIAPARLAANILLRSRRRDIGPPGHPPNGPPGHAAHPAR